MRKILLSTFSAVLLASSLSVQAQNKRLIEMETYSLYEYDYATGESNKLDEPKLTSYEYSFYNAANERSVMLNGYEKSVVSSQYRYEYNDKGLVSVRRQYGTATTGGIELMGTVKYDYDAEGNLIKTTSISSNGISTYTVYEGYTNGEYTVMKNLGNDGETVTYETHYALKFDEANRLVRKAQLTADATTGEFSKENQVNVYLYEGDKLVADTMFYAMADGTYQLNYITTYTYDADGDIATSTNISDTRYGHQENETRYLYLNMNPERMVKNVKAEAIENNKIHITWDNLSGISSYKVLYDNTMIEVMNNSYTTETLVNGDHDIAVLGVFGWASYNISDFVTVNVKDEGNVPMENFTLTDSKFEVVENSWGGTSNYYNLSFNWTVPAGASEISSYIIHVDNGGSWIPTATVTPEEGVKGNDVNSYSTGDSFFWTTFENTETDPDTYETVSLGNGPTCKIWITAVYATGESAPSNVIEVNVYNYTKSDNKTAVEGIETDNTPVEVYSVTGVKMGNDVNALPKNAVYIMKQGAKTWKVRQ